MHPLSGKTAIVTGGTAGIGKEIALTFVRSGAHVAIFGTSAERAAETMREMEEARISPDQQFRAEIVDVASKQAIDAVMQTLLAAWQKIDILVNNAGITRDGLLMKMSEEDWDAVLDVNLKSVYNTCQSLIRSMIKAKSGKIINISSVIGLTGNAGQVNYAASKSGMIGFTKALALEVAARGICVNCVAPGFIQTRMTDVLTEPQKEAILKQIPMARMGSPSDIAEVVLFLASPASSYMTGQVLTVDGGMVM
jgi:3-oxoacyl-[acyl-carrier protein] reductase